MNKNLANYLFHNELLYKNKVEKLKEEIKPPSITTSTIANTAVKLKVKLDSEPQQTQPEEEELPEVFKMKTKHLVVVSSINADEKEFLVKVLMALNMSLSKVDLLIISNKDGSDFKEIIYNNSVQSILFLGEESGGTFLDKLKLRAFQVKEIKQIKFLVSSNLGEISLNLNNEKRLLWDALKLLYISA